MHRITRRLTGISSAVGPHTSALCQDIGTEQKISHTDNLHSLFIYPTTLEIIPENNYLAEVIRNFHQRALLLFRLCSIGQNERFCRYILRENSIFTSNFCDLSHFSDVNIVLFYEINKELIIKSRGIDAVFMTKTIETHLSHLPFSLPLNFPLPSYISHQPSAISSTTYPMKLYNHHRHPVLL